MAGGFKLADQGTLCDPHWHYNSAGLSYILKGTDRITVSGLPKTNAEGNHASRRLRGGKAKTLESLERYSDTFLLEPGDAFYSPIGCHTILRANADEHLVGIAIFDTSDLYTNACPQMMKALPRSTLSQVLGVPMEQGDQCYRVLVDPHADWSEGGGVLKEAREADGDKLQFKISGLNRYLSRGGTRNIHQWPCCHQSC